jgi:hypothetical protein
MLEIRASVMKFFILALKNGGGWPFFPPLKIKQRLLLVQFMLHSMEVKPLLFYSNNEARSFSPIMKY